jgi:hypothetical protein
LAEALTSDAEVRAAYERTQRHDARLTTAMHDLPVPEGLAGRILERLAAAERQPSADRQGDSAALAASAPAVGSPNETTVILGESTSSTAHRWNRRRVVAVIAALAAMILLAVGVLHNGSADRSQLTVNERAVGWYEQLGDAWQPMSRLPKGFAVPKEIGGTARGWQMVAPSVAKSGVVFDVQPGAVLFVLRTSRPELPSSAPRTPQSTTAGFAIGAWQSGPMVYVLVVRGNERTYQKLLPASRPLA